MRRLTYAFTLCLAVTAVACGGDDDDDDDTSDSAATSDSGGGGADAMQSSVTVGACTGGEAATVVNMGTTSFDPTDTVIMAGETVKFAPTGTHTMTSDVGADDSFDTGNVGAGQETCLTFANAGDYPFHCTIHPSMMGSITVN